MADDRLCCRTHTNVDFRCTQSQNRLGPGMSPVRIRYQLGLIDNRNVIIFIKIRHLDGGRHNPASILFDTFLAGPHGTGHMVFLHLFKHFQGQQT